MPQHLTFTVPIGATGYVLDMRGSSAHAGVAMALKPGASGSITCEVSHTKDAADDPANATWVDCGNGAMAANQELVRFAPCQALRFKATTSAGSVEVSK
jgi:hypothetical protein